MPIDEVIDVAAQTVETPAEQPQVQITAQELMYLYNVLINSSVPAVDAEFVVELQRKLKIALNIPAQ